MSRICLCKFLLCSSNFFLLCPSGSLRPSHFPSSPARSAPPDSSPLLAACWAATCAHNFLISSCWPWRPLFFSPARGRWTRVPFCILRVHRLLVLALQSRADVTPTTPATPPRPHVGLRTEFANPLLSAINRDRNCQNSFSPDRPRNPGLLLCLKAIASLPIPGKSPEKAGKTRKAGKARKSWNKPGKKPGKSRKKTRKSGGKLEKAAKARKPSFFSFCCFPLLFVFLCFPCFCFPLCSFVFLLCSFCFLCQKSQKSRKCLCQTLSDKIRNGKLMPAGRQPENT